MTPIVDEDIYGVDYYIKYVRYHSTTLNAKLQETRWSIVQKYRNEGNLLDIGCSVGSFIEKAPSGFNAEGYDVNKFCLIHCGCYDLVTHKKLPIDKRYDVVTMFDVLEHVPNIEDIVVKIKAMLVPKGIWIVTIPNFYHERLESIDKWRHYRPKEHVYCLSENSMKALCQKFDFELLEVNFDESEHRPPKDNLATYIMRKQ